MSRKSTLHLRFRLLAIYQRDDWAQKRSDIAEYHVDTVCMGSDWAGDVRFEGLKDLCDVVYLDRTQGISTTEVKERLGANEM